MDICKPCKGGSTTRRRSTMCFECTVGTFDNVLHWGDEHNGSESYAGNWNAKDLDYDSLAGKPALVEECTPDGLATTDSQTSEGVKECATVRHETEACIVCRGGYTSRRRAESCNHCPPGYYDAQNGDDNCRLCHGSTRRRRAESCTDCPRGHFQIVVEEGAAQDDCQRCEGAVRRRRANMCTDCATGWYDSNGTEHCQSPTQNQAAYCKGWTALNNGQRLTIEACQAAVLKSCSVTNVFLYDHMNEQCGCKSASCEMVPSEDVKLYNAGTCGPEPLNDEDLCQPCLGGSTRRRRATMCAPCEGGFSDDSDDDDCSKCVGETRRRRAKECGDCPLGRFWKQLPGGNSDVCVDCLGGSTRRRRAEVCKDCPDGYFDALQLEYCVRCPAGDENRRRAPSDDTQGPTECASYQ